MDTSSYTNRNTTDYQMADNGNLTKKLPLQSYNQIPNKLMARQNLTLNELNSLFQCFLCKGYLIDATILTGCYHTFCRACILREFESVKAKCDCKTKQGCKCGFICPINDCQKPIYKCNFATSLMPDSSLQEIIYKLIPDLYQNEMKRRKQFYQKNKTPEHDKLSPEDRGEIPENRVYYTVKDQISLSLEYGFGENQMATCDLVGSSKASQLAHSSNENSNSSGSFKSIEQEAAASRRYLLAPAGFSIKLLKKFVLCKWDLPNTKYKAQVFYLNEELDDDLSLMDVAYIHSWKRMAPLRLFYRFIPRQPKVNKLAKLKSSQTNQISNLSSTVDTNNEPIVNKRFNNGLVNRQETHSPLNQPVTKKPRLEQQQQLSPINKINANMSTSLTCNAPKQNLNRSSPLQQSIRSSPVQPISAAIKPIKCVSPSIAHVNSISNSHNLVNNLKTKNNRLNSNLKQEMKPVTSPSLQNQIHNNLNHHQQQIRTTAFTSTKPNVQNSLPQKRPISATKSNNSLNNGLNVLEQIKRNEFESANKYRRLTSNDKEIATNKREFSSPPVNNPHNTSISNQIALENYKQQHRQQQQKQLNHQLKLNQFNQNQMKLPNVNHLNTNLSINFNNLNNFNLNNFKDLNHYQCIQNVLNNSNHTPTTIQSPSTVTSLRNVRVSGTEKKKPSNNMSSNLSSQTLSTAKYNLPISNIQTINKNKTPPKNSFDISSILENTSSSNHLNSHHPFNNLSNHSSKLKDDKLTINLFNSSSLNSLSQMQSTNFDHLNINNNLNNLNSSNLPVSPTSGGHKRKSFDKSPINELGSSVTAKGIKIFSLSSPTGSSSSSNSLNNSLASLNSSSNSQKQHNQSLNKSNSSDKYSPIKPNASVQPIERKSPVIQSSKERNLSSQTNVARKSITVKPNVSSNNNSINSSTNSSIKSLNAINSTQHNSSSQNLIKIAPTLEAVGLLSCSNKLPNTANAKKGSSKLLDEILDKIKTSNGISKSVSESTTSITSSLNGFSKTSNSTETTQSNDASSLSFAQAVNNGLKTAAEQKSTKLQDSSNLNTESNKQITDSLSIKLPLNNSNSNSEEPKATISPNQQSNNGKETKSLFLNSKIEVTIDDDELSKMETNLESNDDSDKKTTTSEQVFSDDDSQDRKLVVVIPETENSCSSSAPDDKITNEKVVKQQTILKQQNQSLCAIQANTPPSSSPDFSKKFPSSRSNSPISTNDEKSNTNDENTSNQIIGKQLDANPVSPPLTPSPRLCEQQGNRENNFGALDLSTRKIPAITLTAPKIAESV